MLFWDSGKIGYSRELRRKGGNMKWKVTGAEKESGGDTVLIVDADTEQLAVEAAVGRGVMVETVTASKQSYPRPPIHHKYRGLDRAAGWAWAVAGCLCIFGVLGLLGFLFGASMALILGYRGNYDLQQMVGNVEIAERGFLAALIFLPVAAFFNLASKAGLALRDIAERGK